MVGTILKNILCSWIIHFICFPIHKSTRKQSKPFSEEGKENWKQNTNIFYFGRNSIFQFSYLFIILTMFISQVLLCNAFYDVYSGVKIFLILYFLSSIVYETKNCNLNQMLPYLYFRHILPTFSTDNRVTTKACSIYLFIYI